MLANRMSTSMPHTLWPSRSMISGCNRSACMVWGYCYCPSGFPCCCHGEGGILGWQAQVSVFRPHAFSTTILCLYVSKSQSRDEQTERKHVLCQTPSTLSAIAARIPQHTSARLPPALNALHPSRVCVEGSGLHEATASRSLGESSP